MDDKMKIFKEKQERVAKTIRREEVDKPAFMLIADGYVPYYSGLKKSDITSYDDALKVMKKINDDLQYDTTLIPFWPANLNVAPMLELLGGGCHVVKDFSKQVCPEKVAIMEADEYPELIKDPVNYLLEKVYPRRYELLRNNNPEEKYNRILQIFGEGQKLAKYHQACAEQGSHILTDGVFICPVDYLFDFFRNFNGIVSDIKRCPELVRDAGLAILEQFKPIIKTMKPSSDRAVFVPMHIPAYLSPRDFEKAFWPSFKGLAEHLAEQGFNVAYYFEKKYAHLLDYLQELPKNGVIGMFQEDDLKVIKKKLGSTMAIAGGLSTTVMQHGTKQQCIDHVKGLIDDLAPGGGYFIAPDTPMMFPVDARPENFKAIADYIINCKL